MITIHRNIDTGLETLGNLEVEHEAEILFSCPTLELPFKNNEHGVSCIPKGKYKGQKIPATHNIPYEHIWIKGVPNRDGICIHIVNFVKDLRGCVGVGDKLVDINKDGVLDLTNSRVTFGRLMAVLPEEFDIEIK